MAADAEQTINFTVGGLNFCLSVEDINGFPDSYFAHLLKDEWHADRSQVVILDRDGQAFRTVHYYMVSGFLFPPKKQVRNLEKLLAIQREADFYNLPDLVSECKRHIDLEMQNIINLVPQAASASFECVSESEKGMTDPLVLAMHPLRYHNIATTHFPVSKPRNHNYANKDIARSEFHRYINDESLQQCLKGTEHNGCRVLSSDFWSDDVRFAIQERFSQWPLNDKYEVEETKLIIILCNKGLSMTRRITGWDRFLYIYSGAVEGGAVSATVNGNRVTIGKTGDCMALAAGVSYSIETVTAGMVVLAEYTAIPGYSWNFDLATEELEWTVHDINVVESAAEGVPNSLGSRIGDNIVKAVDASLDQYDSAVLCLNMYYPITYSHNTNRRFETDSDLLTGIGAELYAVLCTVYDVDVVSVHVKRSIDLQSVEVSCVLDFTSAGMNTDETVSNGDTNAFTPTTTKIVAPLYGYGIKCCSIGTIVTALLISKKTTL